MSSPIHFQVVVAGVERHSSDVCSFRLAWNGRRPRFRPGQFVHVALDPWDPTGHWPESRVFSIASAPSDANGMRLTISRQGRFTARLLDEVSPGRVLSCKGPYGEFEVHAATPGSGVVLIAGGTGVTPFCAFMEEALIHPEWIAGPVRLFYGARSANLLVYRDLVARCATALPGFTACVFAETGELLEDVERGPLDIARIADEYESTCSTYYLSGPQAMITAFRSHLLDVRGIPVERVKVDAWE